MINQPNVPIPLAFRIEHVIKLVAVSHCDMISFPFFVKTKHADAVETQARDKSVVSIAEPCKYTTCCSYCRCINIRRNEGDGNSGDKIITLRR